MSIVPEDGVVAIPRGDSEDDLLPLSRALPPSTDETTVFALESRPTPNSTFIILTRFVHSFKFSLAIGSFIHYSIPIFIQLVIIHIIVSIID